MGASAVGKNVLLEHRVKMGIISSDFVAISIISGSEIIIVDAIS